MRNIVEGEYYHVLNRGVRKQPLFHDERDYVRFLFLLLHSHGSFSPMNIGRNVTYYIRDGSFGLDISDLVLINKTRSVGLVSFCLMPNHFHLLLEEIKEGGISRYMQRVLNAYTKYYNERYTQSGHVFQGKFRSVHIESNNQLLHASAYIHRNPHEIRAWHNKEHDYPWSSLGDYTKENRWPKLLKQDIILGQFDSKKAYKHFIDNNSAKAYEEELLTDI